VRFRAGQHRPLLLQSKNDSMDSPRPLSTCLPLPRPGGVEELHRSREKLLPKRPPRRGSQNLLPVNVGVSRPLPLAPL